MADINEELLNTVVARKPAGKRAREEPVKEEEPDTSAKEAELKRAREQATGLDFDRLEEERREALQRAKSANVHLQRSEKIRQDIKSAEMVNAIMHYVMNSELGGRHNALRNTNRTAPDPLQIMVERSTIQPAALEAVDYLVTPTLEKGLFYCEVKQNPMSLTEETMRRNGRICDAEVDLVGGVCSGMAPEKRKMLYEIVTCGLRGERWTAPAAVPPSAEKEERQLNLFAEEGVQDEETMEDLFKVSSGSDNEEA